MTDLLIKGIEMPDSCEKCPFLDYEEGFCFASGEKGKSGWYVTSLYSGSPEFNTMRNPKCPLVEVPTPHGRLIDESWLKNAMITTLEALKKNPKMDRQEMHLIAAFDTLRAMLEDAPTVIEAEEA